MKKVAIISSQAFSLINFRGPLIKDLIAKEVCVYALAPDYDISLKQEVIRLGAQPIEYALTRTGLNPLQDVNNTFKLIFLLRNLCPDVVLSYFIKPVIYGTLAAWLAGVPRRIAMIEGMGYVFTDDEKVLSKKRSALRKVVSLLYKASLGKAHRVIFLNPDDIDEFVSSGIVSSGKTINLGGIGLDLDEWRMEPPHAHPITFLLAARLLKEKGIVEYAEAARRIKAQYPDIRFVLLGGLDPNPGSLKLAEIQAWVNEGLVEWPGHVPVRKWLKKTSVYVLPSYREGVPRSTQEALAMGCPVITTDAPGCRETVVDGVNGFLVPVRNVEALVHSMLRFIKHPDLIKTMGIASRRLAEERFDVRKVNSRLILILLGENSAI